MISGTSTVGDESSALSEAKEAVGSVDDGKVVDASVVLGSNGARFGANGGGGGGI